MMIRTRVSAVVVSTFTAALGAAAGAQELPQPAQVNRPTVLMPVRHDVTRPLREIPVIPPRTDRESPHPPLPVRGGPAAGPRLPDPSLQTTAPNAGAITPLVSFDGIGNTAGVLPPDTNGDVGPQHYVQWVNLSFAVYRKSDGAVLYGPADGSTLWNGFGGACQSSNDGDPIVLYDERADRWLMSQFALPNFPSGPYYQCLAVSTSGDPTGSWYRYAFSFSKLNDYPKFGVWSDGYYMSINQFSNCTIFGCNWAGEGVVVFERAHMLIGATARGVYFDLASNSALGGMLPADLDGPAAPPAGAPNYFMQFDDQPDQLQLWAFHVDWTNTANSTFTRKALLPTSPFDSNMCGGSRNCIPQPGTTAKIDAIADRLMYRLQYRNFGDHESLVTNHTVDANGADRGGVRWYEVRNPGGAPSIYQQGTFAPADTLSRWMGSAAMDSAGNIGLGYSAVNSLTFPAIRFTGRLAGDPAGTMTVTESDLRIGTGSQTHSSGRWGDYSMLAVDPSDGCTFWYTTEYYSGTSSAGWKTNIGSFTLGNCGGVPPPSPPAAPTSLAATAVTQSRVDLTWTDNSSNESEFRIERCTGDGCVSFAQIATAGAEAQAFSDTTAAAGTTYGYRVNAANAAGPSAYSNTAYATTPAPPSPPAAPTSLGATAVTQSRVDLTWTDNSSNEAEFRIERCTGDGCVSFAQIATAGADAQAFSDTTAAASTTYGYRINAANAAGPSAYSNTAYATTPAPPPPPPGGSVHVASLTPSTNRNGKAGWKATVTVGVQDSSNSPVANVTVSAGWSDGYTASGSCTTGTAGTCSIGTPRLDNAITSVTLTVNNLTHATLTYNPADNVVTSIVVNKP